MLTIIPMGNLNATEKIVLPDIHETGHGWTCTGLAHDDLTDTFLVGDIGKALPSSEGYASQIVRVSSDFRTVVETIPLYTTFTSMHDVQGITIDKDGTIWFCSTSENLIRHIDTDGTSLGSFSVSGNQPTGISYSPNDDSLWVLTYGNSNNIRRYSKTGTVKEQYTFSYNETLDQCFLDSTRGFLYITAGANYTSRNNIYLFNTSTHEQKIICTVDSYAVEGLYIDSKRMVILNDGYYHSAIEGENQANIYTAQSGSAFTKLAGVSTDEKPVMQGDAIFLELDTAKVYYFKNGAWSILG